MIATRIITSEKELYNGRLIIKFNNHRIVLPNNKYKRMYLGKRRYRELINSSIILEIDLIKSNEYHHLPKNIKNTIIVNEPVKIKTVTNNIIIEEPKKKKGFFNSLFGL